MKGLLILSIIQKNALKSLIINKKMKHATPMINKLKELYNYNE